MDSSGGYATGKIPQVESSLERAARKLDQAADELEAKSTAPRSAGLDPAAAEALASVQAADWPQQTQAAMDATDPGWRNDPDWRVRMGLKA